jgi:hypothetical protein
MDTKIDSHHGTKDSDPVGEILKIVQDQQGTLNHMDNKLDQALRRISTLESIVRSFSKHEVRSLLPKTTIFCS